MDKSERRKGINVTDMVGSWGELVVFGEVLVCSGRRWVNWVQVHASLVSPNIVAGGFWARVAPHHFQTVGMARLFGREVG